MGFLDKAKKMAEQAQAKLDEAQQQFNAGQQRDRPPGSVVEYDAHGRPVPQEESDAVAPPHGDALAGQQPPVAAPPPAPAPAAPPAAHGDPVAPEAAPAAQPAADAPAEDPNHPSYAPPKLTSGDPLAG
jgi:hypothetical protein